LGDGAGASSESLENCFAKASCARFFANLGDNSKLSSFFCPELTFSFSADLTFSAELTFSARRQYTFLPPLSSR
jgi:hypothetical protein